MAKTAVSLDIDGDLLANLKAYATQTGCTVTALIERFCQQGLSMALEGSNPDMDADIDSRRNNLATEDIDAVDTDFKNILQRISVLESKVDVSIDVDEYLQNWGKSLELKISSLVDTLVEKRVEDILGAAHHLAKTEPSEQAAIASDAKPIIAPTRGKEPANEYQIDLDYEDEPDEILTDFLEP